MKKNIVKNTNNYNVGAYCNTPLQMIILAIILMLILPSCSGGGAGGGGGTSGVSGTGGAAVADAGGNGNLYMRIAWPAANRDGGKYIPSTATKITIDISGAGMASTQHYEYARPESGQTTVNITLPVGSKTAEIRAVDSVGNTLSYSQSTFNVAAGQTASVNANLGVSINDTGFTPSSITVAKGMTLQFVNNGAVQHSVTEIYGTFNSGAIVPGGSWSYTFNTAGVFNYRDAYNSALTGLITVTDSNSTPAAPSALSATTVSTSQINIAWTSNSSNETGFKIERKTGLGGTYAEITTVGASITSYNNTGLASGTVYYYKVRAYNGYGNSDYSNEASAQTQQDNPQWRVMGGVPNVGALYNVWSNTSSDIFAVGENGAVVHYDGAVWIQMVSGTADTLNGVWGSAGNDVFAVGNNGTIIHYNAAAWEAMVSGTVANLSGVWGSASNNVIAVGATSNIYHYNGAAWAGKNSGVAFGVLFAVWGANANNVFAVGRNGAITKYNGAVWTQMASGTVSWLYGVWGSSDNDVFAVGRNGTIIRYNGADWSAMESGTVENLMRVWGTAWNDVFAVGTNGIILHFNGAAWSTMVSPTANMLLGVWGTAANNVYAVGDASTILRYSP